MRFVQPGVALLLSWCLLLACMGEGFARQTGPQNSPLPPQAVQESPEQLQQLVAPIALYPDALIAQILSAATYPDQVVEAEKWVEQYKDLADGDRAKEIDKQPWDPSVKALTQFTAVLINMEMNLAWTSELGDAYLNQQQDLTAAIQTMRQRARLAGNLQTTPVEAVKTQGQTIVIQPTAIDEVYIPQYDPWLVYGASLAIFPGWYPYPGLFLAGPGVAFDLGFGLGFGAGFGWGWHSWGFDWHSGGRVIYNHNSYTSHSTTIVNRNDVHSIRANVDRAHAASGTHRSAFSGFDHGGTARANSFRGQSSFGGFQGGGFNAGIHGGGVGFHGGGRR